MLDYERQMDSFAAGSQWSIYAHERIADPSLVEGFFGLLGVGCPPVVTRSWERRSVDAPSSLGWQRSTVRTPEVISSRVAYGSQGVGPRARYSMTMAG